MDTSNVSVNLIGNAIRFVRSGFHMRQLETLDEESMLDIFNGVS